LAAVATITGARYANAFPILLETLTAAHSKNPDVSIAGGDGVHPAAPGHLLLVWAFLKTLKAPSAVSSVTPDAQKGSVVSSVGCTITELTSTGGTLHFQRLDDALPLPVPAEAATALQSAPVLNDLSAYSLRVTGLLALRYSLKIDNQFAGDFTRDQLSSGINLAALPGPVTTQTQALLKKIVNKNQLFSIAGVGCSFMKSNFTIGFALRPNSDPSNWRPSQCRK